MTQETAPVAPTVWPTMPKPYSVEQFLDVIADVAKVDRGSLSPAMTIASLDIASLDMVDILFAVEEQYDVYIPMNDELSNVVYLADLISLLVGLIEGSELASETGS